MHFGRGIPGTEAGCIQAQKNRAVAVPRIWRAGDYRTQIAGFRPGGCGHAGDAGDVLAYSDDHIAAAPDRVDASPYHPVVPP